KLHAEDLPPGAPTLAEAEVPQVAVLCRAFEQTTGWQLRHELAQGGLGEAWSAPIAGGGRLVMSASDAGEARPAVELAQSRPLALALAGILGEVNRLRRALWEREAELAA